MVGEGGGGLLLCCWLYMICVAVFSIVSLLQGLVHIPEKFKTGELKPPPGPAQAREQNGRVGPDPTEVFAHKGIIVS